jgi:hypothetical protein
MTRSSQTTAFTLSVTKTLTFHRASQSPLTEGTISSTQTLYRSLADLMLTKAINSEKTLTEPKEYNN